MVALTAPNEVTPVRTSYKRSALLPVLMKQVTCTPPEEVRDWGMFAPPSFEHKGSLGRAFCNDCTNEFLALSESRGVCNRHEINGKSYEPVEDMRDFEAVG